MSVRRELPHAEITCARARTHTRKGGILVYKSSACRTAPTLSSLCHSLPTGSTTLRSVGGVIFCKTKHKRRDESFIHLLY